jgi:hypothetical protein
LTEFESCPLPRQSSASLRSCRCIAQIYYTTDPRETNVQSVMAKCAARTVH